MINKPHTLLICKTRLSFAINYATIFGGNILLVLMLCACKPTSPVTPPPALLPVHVKKVQATTLPTSYDVIAQIESSKVADIVPRISGVIKKRLYKEGEVIKHGQVMFLIDSEPFYIELQRSKATLEKQTQDFLQAKRELERAQKLIEKSAISQKEFDTAKSQEAIQKALLKESEEVVKNAQLNLSYTTVTAPITGITDRFLLSEGDLVKADNTVLTRIHQITPIWARFSLSEQEKQLFQNKLTDVTVTLRNQHDEAYAETGKLDFSSHIIEPNLGTQNFRAVFANKKEALLPGQFMRIHLESKNYQTQFILPQTAVMTGETGKFVWLAQKDKNGKISAQVRPIQEGNWQDNNWIILKGLAENDLVITDNHIKLRPAMPIQLIPTE